MEEQELGRALYLAVPVDTYKDFFQLPFIQKSLRRYAVQLVIYDPAKEEMQQWTKFNTTES
ncbi:hypothetical protein H6F43_06555 [Leptolyngbya sp. FACHB-36]|nr:hypothetical protein [Leptolyngbya sp. FACHB-36]